MLRPMLAALFVVTVYYSMPPCCWWSAVPLRTDAARLASARPLRRSYLARGLTGRVLCPAADDPPYRLVIWSRRGRFVQSSGDDAAVAAATTLSRRLEVDKGGILVIEDVRPSDAGDYRCMLYSPHDNDNAAKRSFVIRVVVRGQCFSDSKMKFSPLPF